MHALFGQRAIIEENRYSVNRVHGSAGRMTINSTIDEFLDRFPDSNFRVNFRMNPESFWRLVDILVARCGLQYWGQHVGPGKRARPPYQQIAIALYFLGSGDVVVERIRAIANVSYGSVYNYVARMVHVLSSMIPEYVVWPSPASRRQMREKHDGELFGDCVGFLDGSDIGLKMKPVKDHETNFSRKKKKKKGTISTCKPSAMTTRSSLTSVYNTKRACTIQPPSSRRHFTGHYTRGSTSLSTSWPIRPTSSKSTS